MTILAIDPGALGGAVLMSDSGRLMDWYAFADGGHRGVVEFVRQCKKRSKTVRAVIEQQWARPGQAKTNFVIGLNYGFWQGVLAANEIGFVVVSPQAWQKQIKRRKSDSTKHAAVREAVQRWPELASLKKKQQSGVCDAALVADYARTGGV